MSPKSIKYSLNQLYVPKINYMSPRAREYLFTGQLTSHSYLMRIRRRYQGPLNKKPLVNKFMWISILNGALIHNLEFRFFNKSDMQIYATQTRNEINNILVFPRSQWPFPSNCLSRLEQGSQGSVNIFLVGPFKL